MPEINMRINKNENSSQSLLIAWLKDEFDIERPTWKYNENAKL